MEVFTAVISVDAAKFMVAIECTVFYCHLVLMKQSAYIMCKDLGCGSMLVNVALYLLAMTEVSVHPVCDLQGFISLNEDIIQLLLQAL